MQSAPASRAIARMLAREPQHDLGLRDRVAGAAALGLVRPVDGLGAGGGQELVEHRRVLGIVEAHHRRRAQEQAAVVGGDPQAGQRLRRRARRSPRSRCRRAGSPAGASPASSRRSRRRARRRPSRRLSASPAISMVRQLQAAVAGRAGDGDGVARGGGQVLRRQGEREQRVGLVRRRRAAAGPVRQLGHLEAERSAPRPASKGA